MNLDKRRTLLRQRALRTSRRNRRRGWGMELLEDRRLLAIDFQGLADGVDDRLDAITADLQVLGQGNPLPVVNRPFSEIAAATDAVASFQTELHDAITDVAHQTSAEALQDGIFQALAGKVGDTDANGLIDEEDVIVSSFSPAARDVAISLRVSYVASPDTADFGLGLDGVPFLVTTSNDAAVSTAVDFKNLIFGLDGNVFFMDTAGDHELEVTVDATLPNTAAVPMQGLLGMLSVNTISDQAVADAAAVPTSFHGAFALDIGASGVTDPQLNGSAHVDLDLNTAYGADIPDIKAELVMNWVFQDTDPNAAASAFGYQPTVQFNDLRINVGSFLSELALPKLENLKSVLSPVQGPVEQLTAPLPVVSDLAGEDVSAVDLAVDLGFVPPEVEAWVGLLQDVIDVTNNIPGVVAALSQVDVSFGNLDLGSNGDLRTLPAVDFAVATTQDLTQLILTGASQLTFQDVKDQILTALSGDPSCDANCQNAVENVLNFFDPNFNPALTMDFPILQNTGDALAGLLAGRNADLFHITAHFTLGPHVGELGPLPIPIGVGGVIVDIDTSIHLDALLGFGYDTAGLRKFMRDTYLFVQNGVPTPDPQDLRQGVYIDTDSHVVADAAVAAQVFLLAPLLFAEGSGGVSGNLNLHVNPAADSDGDGKFRLFSELSDCLFQSSGSLTAGFDATVAVGIFVFPIGIVPVWYSYTIPNTTLVDLSAGCIANPFDVTTVHLAQLDAAGVLTLNMGSAARRAARNVATSVINESFQISPLTSPSGNAVLVSAFGLSQAYEGVTEIRAFADNGDDIVRVAEGISVPARLEGGVGNDLLSYLGDGNVTILGGAGEDGLTGGAGNNLLDGGLGNDQLQGGSGPSLLRGQSGHDTLLGGTGSSALFGDGGKDKLVAGPESDILSGGPGNDQLFAVGGNDDLFGDDGDDALNWQVTVGTPADVDVDGGAGNDVLGISASDLADIITASPSAADVLVHAADDMIQSANVENLNLEGRGGGDIVTIDYLAANVSSVGIDLGDEANLDGQTDVVTVKGGPTADELTVEKESAFLQIPSHKGGAPVAGGIMKISGLRYIVRTANIEDDLRVHTYQGGDRIDVRSITGPTSVHGGAPGLPADGDDTINVYAKAAADYLAELQIDAGAGTNTLLVSEAATAVSDTMLATSLRVESGLLPGVNYQATSGDYLGGVTLEMGSGQDALHIRDTLPGVVTTVRTGDGDDTLIVASDAPGTAGNLNGIRGILTTDGENGADALVLSDAGETDPTRATVDDSHVGGAPGDNLFGAGGELKYTRFEQLSLTLGTNDDSIRVPSTSPITATFLYGGNGKDGFLVSKAGRTGQIQSPLTIDGGGDFNSVRLSNTADLLSDHVTITDTQVLSPGNFFAPGGSLTYAHLNQLDLATSQGPDRVLIQSTSPGTVVDVASANGDDLFLVDSNGLLPGGDVNGIASPIRLRGGLGVNQLAISDADGAEGATVTVDPIAALDGSVGAGPSDDYFTGGQIQYRQMHLLALITSQFADVVHAQPAPSGGGTNILVAGNPPAIVPGDQVDALRLDLSGVHDPVITVGGLGTGELTSTSHNPIRYSGIQRIDEISHRAYDLVLDMNASGLAGNDGGADRVDASSSLNNGVKDLNLLVNGASAFVGSESSVQSLEVLGSTDSDNLVISETAAGLPALSGKAAGGHENAVYVPANVGIHYDGGAGGGLDEVTLNLTSPHVVSKVDDVLDTSKSGNINVEGQFTMSYESLSPVRLQGAGGVLHIDARQVTDLTELRQVNFGGDRFEVSGNGGFETTTFAGFDDHTLDYGIEAVLDASVVVNSTGDASDLDPGDGKCQTSMGSTECTLRAAIEETNANPDQKTILFDIPGPCPHLIQPATALPPITDSVIIDGYSQPGSAPNTLSIDQGTNAKICIEVNGGLITDGSSGLVFQSAGNVLRGLSITGFGYPDMGDPGSPEEVPVGGVVLLGGQTRVEGNFIGVDPDGLTADPNNFYGVFVMSSENTIGGPRVQSRNLISGNQGFGIQLTSGDLPGGPNFVPAESNTIQGNLIGTNRKGTKAVPNTGGGVILRLHARNNLIGGRHVPLCEPTQICLPTSEVRNIISGNGGPFTPFGDPNGPYQDWPDAPYPVSGGHGSGIQVENLTTLTPNEPVPNTIQGNFVGTSANGMAALPNKHDGVTLVFTNSVTVGGPRAAGDVCQDYCNLVSANGQHGITISGTYSRDIVVQGNSIGTNRTGMGPLGNRADGVFVFIASGNLIGGAKPSARNLIAYNRTGVVVKGNPDEPFPGGNTIRLNSIHSNRKLGIDLVAKGIFAESDGPTLNDPLDADSGPNGLQNFPELTAAVFGPTTLVAGTLHSLPKAKFRLDFYASSAADPSGFGEGQRWLGAVNVATNAAGNATYSVLLSSPTVGGEWITATATRNVAGVLTDTSEFSRAFRLNTGVGLADCQLQIHGTEGPDQIQVSRADDTVSVSASFLPQQVRRFRARGIDTVEVLGRGGDDSMGIDLVLPASGAAPARPCSSRSRLVLDTGLGDDTATLAISNEGKDPLELQVDADTGPGSDSLTVDYQGIFAELSTQVRSGEGDDRVSVKSAAGPESDGSARIDVSVDAGPGLDQVLVDFQVLDPTGDVQNLFDVEGGADSDWIQLNTTSAARTGRLTFDGQVSGGDGSDRLDLLSRVGFNPQPEPPIFNPVVDGGAGQDQVTIELLGIVEPLTSAIPPLQAHLMVDLGEDDDTFHSRIVDLILGDSTFEALGGVGADVMQLEHDGTGFADFAQKVLGGDGADNLAVKWNAVDVQQKVQKVRAADLLVMGDQGADQILIEASATTGDGNWGWTALGGDGDDRLTLGRTLENVGGNAMIVVDAGHGRDVLSYNTSELVVAGHDGVSLGGGTGDDRILVSRADEAVGSAQLTILGAGGQDFLQKVSERRTVTRKDVQLLDGGRGRDHVSNRVVSNEAAEFDGKVLGGDEDDRLLFSLLDSSAILVSALLDGGSGFDTCLARNVAVINCEA